MENQLIEKLQEIFPSQDIPSLQTALHKNSFDLAQTVDDLSMKQISSINELQEVKNKRKRVDSVTNQNKKAKKIANRISRRQQKKAGIDLAPLYLELDELRSLLRKEIAQRTSSDPDVFTFFHSLHHFYFSKYSVFSPHLNLSKIIVNSSGIS